MIVELKRIEEADDCTRGTLLINGKAFCVTLENPWKNNTPMISCIPKGIYYCRQVDSPKYGKTYEVANVHGRTHILFHAGNTENHTKGCILLGKYFGELNGQKAVLDSKKTINMFLYKMLAVDSFSFYIS